MLILTLSEFTGGSNEHSKAVDEMSVSSLIAGADSDTDRVLRDNERVDMMLALVASG